MSTSVKYQIPPSKQLAVLPGRLICHCKCHLFILSLPSLTAPTSSRSLSPFAFHSKPPSPPFLSSPFLPLTVVSNTWQTIGPRKGILCFHFPKRGQKTQDEDELSAAGCAEKIVQNCLIPGQISECIQSLAKCYCAPQFGPLYFVFSI